jgi:predicted ATPase
MESIKIQNLRSLVNTGEIEMKPINVILGANSSGKSSYLRFFPLLKQTIGRKIKGVLFWSGYGDDDVDFGDFETSLNNQENHAEMIFSFSFFIDKRAARNYYRMYRNRYVFEKEQKVDIAITLRKDKKDTSEKISRIKLKIFGREVRIDVKDSLLVFNNNEYRVSKSDMRFLNKLDSIFGLDSLFSFSTTSEEFISENILNIEDIDWKERSRYSEIMESDFLSHYVQTTDDLKILDEKPDINQQEYVNMLLIDKLDMIFRIIDNYITSYFKQSVYIAPLRATAERYYRLRDLSIDEVDSSGRNLAEFLYNIETDKFKDFQNWTNKNLGFQVEKEDAGDQSNQSKGYVSIFIKKYGQDKRYNLSDTGFGYSQILPIVTQLWDIKQKSSRILIPKVVIIEQPELHLHPKLQGKLISAICSLASSNCQFIIETHSETIVNTIGELIYKKQVESKDTSILFFSKDENDSETRVEKSYYDEEGYLVNWPVGFFDGDSKY